MTILTKPSNEKKTDKVPLPLADEVAMLAGTAPPSSGTLMHPAAHFSGSSSDIDADSMIFRRHPHFTCLKTAFLFLMSVIVMLMGILGGYTLYRKYSPSHANLHYRAFCDVPYQNGNMSTPRFYGSADDIEIGWRQLMSHFRDPIADPLTDDNYFREEIELDASTDEGYSKIDVPDFKDGRRGRFMHDFKENQSAIIDTTANRCFIMSLDRDTTLPPKSFLDLVQKMGSGYYNIDTDRVRRHMRVVTPPITDFTLISERIANECYDMKVYMLERYISGVFKRDAKPLTEAGKFAEFSGKGIIEFDLMNIADIEAFENKQHKE